MHDPTPDEEMDWTFEKASEPVREIAADIRGMILRGNTGGVVASLSFLGAAYGRGHAIPELFAWALLSFLFGTLFTIAVRLIFLHEARRKRLIRTLNVVTDPDHQEFLTPNWQTRTTFGFDVVAFGLLLAGIGAILFAIWPKLG